MDRRTFTSMAVGATLTAGESDAEAANVRSRLIGCWTLLQAETVTDGKVTPWMGRKLPLAGILIYNPNGWVSTQISGARPAVKTWANFAQLPDAKKLESLSAYYGYYGRYEVDEAAHTVTHSLVDSLWPYEKGKYLRRTFVLKENVLRLTTMPQPTIDGRTTYFNRLTWKKSA